MAKSVDVRGRADRMATARRGVYRPTAAGLQKVTSGTSGAASALITRGGTCEINREYGSTGVYARTRIFGVSKRAATLRACAVFLRRLTSRTTKKLAGLPYSRTPCEISGTRHIGPGSAWPENVPSRWRANSATWKRHGSFCDSSCSVAAQRCDESFEPRCIGRDGDRVDDSRAAAVRPTATA
jgi:hypothetical protein